MATLTMGAVPTPRAVKAFTRWCPAMIVPVALLTITGLVIPILAIDSLSFSIFSSLIFRGL
jgi:putative copper export protein